MSKVATLPTVSPLLFHIPHNYATLTFKRLVICKAISHKFACLLSRSFVKLYPYNDTVHDGPAIIKRSHKGTLAVTLHPHRIGDFMDKTHLEEK